MVESGEQNSDNDKRALIAGAGGLLGRFIAARLEAVGWRVFAFPHEAFDICEERDVRARFAESRPHLVVNCAATTDVDRCERDRDWAHAVNVLGPRLLAQRCSSNGADLVHISTDYVFDGLKGTPYTQEDAPNPLSVYAETKLAGELAVRDEAKRFYIVRSSWIFGPGGKNFGSRVIEYARQGVGLRAVTDQISIPTYAPDLAARIIEVVGLRAHGLYHITNTGSTSWYDFARLALDLAGFESLELAPVTREALKQVATRPHDTSMRCLVSENLGLPPLRHWRDALEEFVRQYETRSAAPEL
jgi:dTDP-4-dehydrorhamnose reductase